MIQLIHSMLYIGELLAFKIRIIKLNYMRSVENKSFHYLKAFLLFHCKSLYCTMCILSSRSEEWSKVCVIVWTGVADIKENSLLPPNDALYSYRNRENKKNYQVKANIYICHKIPRNNLFLSIHDIYFYSENVFIRIQHSVSVLSESWLKQKTFQSLHIFVAKLNISLNQIPGSLNCWGWPSNRTNFGSLCVL